jgi:hypothetical protein
MAFTSAFCLQAIHQWKALEMADPDAIVIGAGTCVTASTETAP